MIRCIEVRLTIPDNEAYTAFETLRRLGVRVGGLERADLYRCDVAEAQAAGIADELRACEGLFNQNKHSLTLRVGDAPGPGEVWIEAADGSERLREPVTLSGRTLAGVRVLERFTAWRLTSKDDTPATCDVVAAATHAILCNAAFEVARFMDGTRDDRSRTA